MSDYSLRIAWDEYIDPPREVYVMVGNGFDVECGLPTRYGDFLTFLSAVERLNKNTCDELKDVDINANIKDALLSCGKYDIWKPVVDNFWYKHFRNSELRLRWIDFEFEISKVIQVVENSMDLRRYSKASMEDYISCYEGSEIARVMGNTLLMKEVIEEEVLQNGSKYLVFKYTYRDLRDKLLKDLNALIEGFEVYLRDFVERIDVTPTDNIRFLMEKMRESSERYVISFNYTTTFEGMLKEAGISAEFCYVHGKIGDANSKNRMVLGIDEHLGTEGIRNLIGYAPFRKYNQRIFKRTDSNYMDWIDNITEGGMIDRMLYIFGHSLGYTDKDIIGAFIQANDMRSVIFYHSEDTFVDQVSNLTAIIGMDEMIRRTGGSTHTMEFRKQI